MGLFRIIGFLWRLVFRRSGGWWRVSRRPYGGGLLTDYVPPAMQAGAAANAAEAAQSALSAPVSDSSPDGVTHQGPIRWGFLGSGFFRRLSWKWKLLLIGPALAGGAGAATLSCLMIYFTVAYPHPHVMRNKERAPVIRILARDGAVLAERGTAHDYMPLDLLPRHVQAAVVATEDRRFYDHHGIDPVGMIRAFFANLRAGRFAQGGSTLTQQLAKNLFLTHDRTLGRKIEEFALALWLELRLSKDEILELYLNRVYFGSGAYGIEAASQRYFDKSAREMSLAEAAIIAGLLKAPSRYSPSTNPQAALARAKVVLDKMIEVGFISPADRNKAVAEKVVFYEPKSGGDTDDYGYAVDFVLDRLPPLLGDGHAEIVVETTLDAELQKNASRVVETSLAKKGPTLGASQGAMVVLDNDGGILALVGGRSYTASQFNRAVKARRQPGSVFKPFVYLAAMESGLTPDSPAFDLPLTIGGWSPKNDSGTYQGEVTLRRALAQSINTVAVRLNQDLGPKRTADVARRLGVKSELRDDASLALGTSEVSLIEMVGAFAVFGNGGMAVEPHAIRRVRMSSGRVLYAREAPRTEQIVDIRSVGAMNDMLNAALVSGTGRRAAIARHPAAGKTGTTQDFRDAWFVGYTSHMTAGVWIGNDDGKPMNRSVGGGLPAEIWHQVMEAAHLHKAPLALPGTMQRVADGVDTAGDVDVNRVGAPRVDQTHDDLPWMASGPESQLAKAPVATHPRESIDADLIAQVLAEGDANHGEAAGEKSGFLSSFGRWW